MMIMNFDDDDSQNRVNDHDRLDGYNHHDNHYFQNRQTIWSNSINRLEATGLIGE